MEKRILTEAEKIKYTKDILEMMKISDNDFVPPLSSRTSTTQSDLSGGGSGGIELYFNEMIKQKVLGAFEGDKLFGIVSFRENYETDIVKELPNIYISTLVAIGLIRIEPFILSLTVKVIVEQCYVAYCQQIVAVDVAKQCVD